MSVQFKRYDTCYNFQADILIAAAVRNDSNIGSCRRSIRVLCARKNGKLGEMSGSGKMDIVKMERYFRKGVKGLLEMNALIPKAN